MVAANYNVLSEFAIGIRASKSPIPVGNPKTSVIGYSERRACGLSQRLGPIGAIIVGVVTGTVTLLLTQLTFATMPSPLIRFMVALLFAAPAA
jgi:hypothetical protein